jgi:DNA-binding CsgD family transcriptional regulator
VQSGGGGDVGARSEKPAGAPTLMTRAQALRSDDPLHAVQAHTLDAVVAVIPASAAVFASVSRRLAIECGVALVNAGARVDLRLLRSVYAGTLTDDPFAPRRLDPPHTTVLALEHLAAREPAYVASLREAGWADRLTTYLRVAGTIAGVVSLLRLAREPRFAAGDASRLRRIQPLLENVYAAALEPEWISPREALTRNGLTPREIDVAELVGRGASNADIARSLHVSETTVKTHLTRIYTKVGVQTRTQLAVLVGGRR